MHYELSMGLAVTLLVALTLGVLGLVLETSLPVGQKANASDFVLLHHTSKNDYFFLTLNSSLLI